MSILRLMWNLLTSIFASSKIYFWFLKFKKSISFQNCWQFELWPLPFSAPLVRETAVLVTSRTYRSIIKPGDVANRNLEVAREFIEPDLFHKSPLTHFLNWEKSWISGWCDWISIFYPHSHATYQPALSGPTFMADKWINGLFNSKTGVLLS